MTSELTLSLKIKTEAAQARDALRDLINQVRESGRAASDAEREAIRAARDRARETRAVARAHKDMETLGVRSTRSIRDEMARVEAALGRLRRSSATTGTDMARATDAAKRKMAELKAELVGAQERSSGLGDKFREIWGGLVAGAGAVAILGKAAKEAIAFESALIDLQRAANTDKRETAELGRELKKLGQELGIAAGEMVKMATAAAKAGIAKADLLEFTRITALAAMNFDMIPAEAGDSLAKLKNILKISVGEMEAFVATINELADNAAASERDIIEALKGGGGSATLFGLDPKQAAALATGFLNVGASAEQAGTAMRTLLGRIRPAINDTGKAGQALRGIVGDTRQFAQVLSGDANTALNLFLRGLSKLSRADQAKALRDVFQEGLDTDNIAKLVGNLQEYEQIAARAGKSDDELIAGLRDLTNLKLESTESELNKLGVAARNAGESLGRLFLPFIRATAVALVYLADIIQTLVDTFPGLSRIGVLAVLFLAFAKPVRLLIGLLGKLGLSAGSLSGGIRSLLGVGGRLKTGLGQIIAVAAGTWSKIRRGVALMTVARAGFVGLRIAIGGLMGPIGWVITGLTLLWDAWNLFAGDDNDAEKAIDARKKAFQELDQSLKNLGDATRQVKDQIGVALENASAPIKALADDYKLAAKDIKDSLDTQLKAISDNAKERQRIAGQSGLSERDLIRAQARIVMEAEQQKVDAIRLAGEQMDAAWQQTYGRAIELARTAGQDTAKLEQEATDAKIASYKMQEDAYKATIDALVAEEKRHLDAVREIENQRYLLKLSTEDRIRALRQRAMSDVDAYADRNRQYEEKMAKAQEDLAKGNYERARKFADEAMRIAERNAQEVTRTVEAGGKKTQETVVSLQQATETASGQIEAAAKVADQAWEQAGKTEADTVSRIQGEMSDAKKALDEVKAKLDEINAAQQNAIALKIEADTHEADASIERLKQLVTAQALVAKVETDLHEAQKTLDAWRADPQNKELALSAKVDQAILDTTLANLRDAIQAADLQAPAGLDTTPAKTAFEGLVKTLNETKTTSTHTVEDDVPETLGNLEKLNKRDTKSTHTVGSNAPAVRKEIDQLKKNTSSTHTIYVRKVPAGGGSGGSEPAPQKRATGGWVQAFASGGRAWRRMVGHISGPGTGTSDSIRALLSNGEFVLRERASRLAAQALPGFLERLNAISSRADLHALLSAVVNAGLPPVPRFSTGGHAVPASIPSSSESLTVTFRAGDMEAPVRVTDPDSRQMLKDVVRELGRLGLIAGRSA